MAAKAGIFDARARKAEKQLSRSADVRALASGAKDVAQLKRENEVFAPLARDARIDLAAARRLA